MDEYSFYVHMIDKHYVNHPTSHNGSEGSKEAVLSSIIVSTVIRIASHSQASKQVHLATKNHLV